MARINTLKNTLRSYLPSEIDLNDFIKTEMTLFSPRRQHGTRKTTLASSRDLPL